MRTVVALGGHLLANEAVGEVQGALALLGGEELVLTHGNGPQVGAELERSPDTPIHVAVARTQAEIGSQLAVALGAVCVVTHVVVDEDDPAFREPTKPIGPSYSELEARCLQRAGGWSMAEDGHRGWRRFVPSPEPREIVELPAVRALVESGTLVIACGGGGIPVNSERTGVAAVIDKDRASALLAEGLGARRMIVLTDVDALYRDYRTSSETAVSRLTPDEAEALLADLPAGSMRPKVEACTAFVRATGGEALITSARALEAALGARAGTRIAT